MVRSTLASDIEEEGGTAFIAANVMAKLLKGSAVFWMLTADDGRTNKKTVHAGTEIILNCKLCENIYYIILYIILYKS